MTSNTPTDATGQTITRSATPRRASTAAEVRDVATALFSDFADAAKILPLCWITDTLTDLLVATRYEDHASRGDAARRALADLHEALSDAHDRLQRARAATKPPARAVLVG